MSEAIRTKQIIQSHGDGRVTVRNGSEKEYNLFNHEQQVRFFTDTQLEWYVMMAVAMKRLPEDVQRDLNEAVAGTKEVISWPHELVKLLARGVYTLEL